MAFQSWPHNPSSRRKRRYSLCVNPGQCRSCSSGPSLLHFHGKIIECTVHWASSGQTCRQCDSPLKCVSWNTQWPPSPGKNTANQLALRGAGSIGCRSHHTWGCRLALGAERPTWRQFCLGMADSRTGNKARWGTSGSSSKHWQRDRGRERALVIETNKYICKKMTKCKIDLEIKGKLCFITASYPNRLPLKHAKFCYHDWSTFLFIYYFK